MVCEPETGALSLVGVEGAIDLHQVRTTWVFKVWSKDSGYRIARLDPKTLELAYAGGAHCAFEPVRVDAGSVLGIEDHKRIVRVTCGSDRREVVFPR